MQNVPGPTLLHEWDQKWPQLELMHLGIKIYFILAKDDDFYYI